MDIATLVVGVKSMYPEPRETLLVQVVPYMDVQQINLGINTNGRYHVCCSAIAMV